MGAFRHGPGCNCCGGGGDPGPTPIDCLSGCGGIPQTLFATDGNGTTTLTYTTSLPSPFSGSGWYGTTSGTIRCRLNPPFCLTFDFIPAVVEYFLQCPMTQLTRIINGAPHPICECVTSQVHTLTTIPTCNPFAGTYTCPACDTGPWPTGSGNSVTISE